MSVDLPKIENYETISLLGEGGVGRVFKIKKTGLSGFSKFFAMKILHEDIVRGQESFFQSFVSEACLVSRLNHPNIVQVQELGQGNHGIYVTMEFIQGLSLDKLMEANQGTPLPTVIALLIVRDILSALEYIQNISFNEKKISIIHGDISLQNIMIQDSTYVAKLNDFGFSRGVTYGKSAKVPLPIVGNPYYISPEHISGAWIDRRSDIYSLGLVLYDLVIADRSFGYSLSVVKELSQQGQTINRSQIEQIKDEGLKNILSKMTSIDPKMRYDNPQEALNEIDSYLSHLQIEGQGSLRSWIFNFYKDLFAKIESMRLGQSNSQTMPNKSMPVEKNHSKGIRLSQNDKRFHKSIFLSEEEKPSENKHNIDKKLEAPKIEKENEYGIFSKLKNFLTSK